MLKVLIHYIFSYFFDLKPFLLYSGTIITWIRFFCYVSLCLWCSVHLNYICYSHYLMKKRQNRLISLSYFFSSFILFWYLFLILSPSLSFLFWLLYILVLKFLFDYLLFFYLILYLYSFTFYLYVFLHSLFIYFIFFLIFLIFFKHVYNSSLKHFLQDRFTPSYIIYNLFPFCSLIIAQLS